MLEVEQTILTARQRLYENSGIYVSGSQLEYFGRQLEQRRKELELGAEDAYLELLNGPEADREIHQLLKLLFVADTRFLSHRLQTSAIVEQAVPDLLKEKRSKVLTVWYHGLGGGEGMYSLCLLLQEQNRRFGRNFRFEIMATDLNEDALTRTAAAVFRKSSVSHLDRDLLNRYFEEIAGRKFRFLPPEDFKITLKLMTPHDESQWQEVGQPDLILFQNILMYYSMPHRKQIARQLYGALAAPGYLFAGPTESLYQVTDLFRIVHFRKTLGYMKPVDSSRTPNTGK